MILIHWLVLLFMPKNTPNRRWGSRYKDRRDWPTYNRQLIRRGEFYISLDFLDSWDIELEKMNLGKIGRRFEYPDKFIRWTALVYHAMNIPYRTLQGFLRKLSEYITRLKSADYTTLFRRIKKVSINLIDTIHKRTENVVVAVDSSGIKVTTRGDWIRHKWKRAGYNEKGWIKVHMAVDIVNKEILALDITDEKVGDDSRFRELMEQCKNNIGDAKIERVLADGAYDKRKVFNYLMSRGIRSGVRMRKDANFTINKSLYRTNCIYRRFLIGEEKWKEEVGYSMRWASETCFSSVKRMFGEWIRAKSKSGGLIEAYRKFVFYNMVNNYGKGEIPRV